MSPMNYATALVLNAWQFPASIRHEVIFALLAVLPQGATLTLINDHDPKPLFYQIDAEHPGVFYHTTQDADVQKFAVEVTRLV